MASTRKGVSVNEKQEKEDDEEEEEDVKGRSIHKERMRK